MNRKHLAGAAVLAALISGSAWAAQQSPTPGTAEAIQALQCEAKKAQCAFKACPTGQTPVMTATPCECICKVGEAKSPPATPLPPPLVPGAPRP